MNLAQRSCRQRFLLVATVFALLAALVTDLCAQQPSPRREASEPAGATAETPASVPEGRLPRGRKIVLTDGSFQLAREYHREGDRVRYYSVERSAWEELPASLVDWEATEKAAAEYEAEQRAVAERVRVTEQAARAAYLDVDTSLEVGPGIFLPDDDGLFAFDGRTVVEMEQSEAHVSLNRGRAALRILTGMPMIDTKHSIEVPGKRAKVRFRGEDLEFYFRGVDGREPRFVLVRAEVQGDQRKLETMVTNMVGQVSYENNEVTMLKWNVAGKVYRFAADQRLEPGEYALIERTSEGVSLWVWDFGVDAPGR